MNNSPKLVASSTLTTVDWAGATLLPLLDGDVAAALTALKQEPGDNITITGSATLVRSLVHAEVLDELHLMVCPIVVGNGKRLFDDTGKRTPLRLAASETFPTGVAHLTYQPA